MTVFVLVGASRGAQIAQPVSYMVPESTNLSHHHFCVAVDDSDQLQRRNVTYWQFSMWLIVFVTCAYNGTMMDESTNESGT